MPRPKTKNELLDASQENYQQLVNLLEQFSSSQLHDTFPFEHRDRCVRDVLAHLHEWHLMMHRWYETGMNGETPIMPAAGYTWKETPALNQVIFEKYQRSSLKSIRSKLKISHDKMVKIIRKHSEKELFEKRRYTWTGSTSLGSYLISATSAHYLWAIKLLKKYKRSCE